jgi:acid phosphatase family membrane protein YuiD
VNAWRYLLPPLLAWGIAQFLKVLLVSVRQRRLNLRVLAETGGMPSSHSALVTGLTFGIGRINGFNSAPFAIALIFAFVVMYDAAGVRRAVSLQARVLNRMLTEMIEAQHFNEERLRELIGHTRFEVAVGALLGALAAISLR